MTMETPFSLPINVPRDQVRAFFERYGVEELALFGSVLREDFRPDSDIDVLLKFRPGQGFTFENTPDIYDELERISGRPVDVVEKDRIRNPFHRQAILKNYQVIHAA